MTDGYDAALAARARQRQANADREMAAFLPPEPWPTPNRHHRDDPDTSRDAGILVAERASMIRAAILTRLRDCRPDGLTSFEIDDAEGWEHNTSARRLSELWREVSCMVERGPDTRTRAGGRPALVWRLA